jgi:hypothetical protein
VSEHRLKPYPYAQVIRAVFIGCGLLLGLCTVWYDMHERRAERRRIIPPLPIIGDWGLDWDDPDDELPAS